MEKLKTFINQANKIVVLTGAGISTPSGIPDFRSSAGLFEKKTYKYSPEEILSRTFFFAHPAEFYDYYKNQMIYLEALPNEAHKTLAKLEENDKLIGIITQNIDGLHSKAGSKNVLELHGTINENHCLSCNKAYSIDKIIASDIPYCDCGGLIKPNVVLYEEPLNQKVLAKAISLMGQADLCLVIGTSLLVQPAASLINYFRGNTLVIINRDPTPYDAYADLIIREPLENVLTLKLLN